MGKTVVASGQHRTLSKHFRKLLVAATASGLLALGNLAPVVAGGETRTISLRHMHTGESLTIEYMKDGRYVPSAMKQINYLLRDWRKNQVITIDPRTIDLVWELHEDLGSHEPIQIVCGYRSASTNAFLHRIGRHVAKESQHIQGKAIDFYFPDVPTIKIRNAALVRQVGGVGYYSSAGGPTGFLHADSARVRHWGPAISASQMAAIFRDNQKIVGRRLRMNAGNDTAVASNDSGSKPNFFTQMFGGKKNQAPVADDAAPDAPGKANGVNALYSAGDQDDLADLSDDAAQAPAPKAAAAKPGISSAQQASMGDLSQDAAQAPAGKPKLAAAPLATQAVADAAPDVKQDSGVPKPRFKPTEILLAAAANMKTPQVVITAASAPPPNQNGGLDNDKMSMMTSVISAGAVSPVAPKAGLLSTKNANAKAVQIKPMIASAGDDINWWPQTILRNGDEQIRRDGQPPLIGAQDQNTMPVAANIGGGGSSAYAADNSDMQRTADGKGDLQVVNEEGKGDL